MTKERLITVIGDSRLTHWGQVRWLAAPNGNQLVSFSEDGSLLFWNRDDGSIQRAFYDVASASYCPEARQIVMCDLEGKVRIWSYEAETELPLTWNLPVAPQPGILASPDARYLIQFGLENSLLIWSREKLMMAGFAGWFGSPTGSTCCHWAMTVRWSCGMQDPVLRWLIAEIQ